MHNYSYLILDIGVLATAFGLGIWKQSAWLSEWRRTLTALLVVAAPFIVWDISATWRGHWGFNPDFTLGVALAGLPIEEMLFFLAIPLLSIAIWELTPVRADMGRFYRPSLWAVIAASALLLLSNIGHEYSLLVGIIAAGTAGLWLVSPQPIRQWLFFMACMFGLFLIANTLLTLLPIVEYSAAHYSGIRIGSIPLEDFFYNFALVNLTIISWLYIGAARSKSR